MKSLIYSNEPWKLDQLLFMYCFSLVDADSAQTKFLHRFTWWMEINCASYKDIRSINCCCALYVVWQLTWVICRYHVVISYLLKEGKNLLSWWPYLRKTCWSTWHYVQVARRYSLSMKVDDQHIRNCSSLHILLPLIVLFRTFLNTFLIVLFRTHPFRAYAFQLVRCWMHNGV